jgi:acylphosphatase
MQNMRSIARAAPPSYDWLMSEELSGMHAVVTGVVQGVNFRYHTRRVARSLGLTGWVRNRADGTVEVVAEGPRSQLQALLDYLRKGPEMARVDGMAVTWTQATRTFPTFEIAA